MSNLIKIILIVLTGIFLFSFGVYALWNIMDSIWTVFNCLYLQIVSGLLSLFLIFSTVIVVIGCIQGIIDNE